MKDIDRGAISKSRRERVWELHWGVKSPTSLHLQPSVAFLDPMPRLAFFASPMSANEASSPQLALSLRPRVDLCSLPLFIRLPRCALTSVTWYTDPQQHSHAVLAQKRPSSLCSSSLTVITSLSLESNQPF